MSHKEDSKTLGSRLPNRLSRKGSTRRPVEELGHSENTAKATRCYSPVPIRERNDHAIPKTRSSTQTQILHAEAGSPDFRLCNKATFLNMDEDHVEQKLTVGEDSAVKKDVSKPEKENAEGNGASFDCLVDRLLSQPNSKSDAKFAAMLLCLYRKFAAPSELLSAIISRFQSVEDSETQQNIRTTTQLRHLGILSQWVRDYPGDFAHPMTRLRMTSFLRSLSSMRAFSIASKDMGSQLDVVSEDDDTEWACSDTSRGRADTAKSFLSIDSAHSMTSTLSPDSSSESVAPKETPRDEVKHASTRVSATPSAASSASRSDNLSTGSFQTLLNSVENATRQAQLLRPAPRSGIAKFHWRQLMDAPEEDIAHELTRIDWILLSSIRPRDLVRHVSLSGAQKEKCKSLENVNRMINQFNHTAFWVTNMILLRDKPKHRARMLEKMMGVAWKIRYLNNYNSLGAILAGISHTATHRLAQTWDLVSPDAQKQFMRLEILMGTQKSHFAYRLAWANTSSERIPFLPLHRRDLVSAEEGNPTFINIEEGRINWKKFEIMGEVIVEIQKSQGTSYSNIRRNDDMQRLILELNFSKDDDVSDVESCVCVKRCTNFPPRW